MSDDDTLQRSTTGHLPRPAPIMEPEDIADSLRARILHLRKLLVAVHDAGRPHSHLCECDHCLAWDAVRKELRGE